MPINHNHRRNFSAYLKVMAPHATTSDEVLSKMDNWWTEIDAYLGQVELEYPVPHPTRLALGSARARIKSGYQSIAGPGNRRTSLSRQPTMLITLIDGTYASSGLTGIQVLPVTPPNHVRHWTSSNEYLFIETKEGLDQIALRRRDAGHRKWREHHWR